MMEGIRYRGRIHGHALPSPEAVAADHHRFLEEKPIMPAKTRHTSDVQRDQLWRTRPPCTRDAAHAQRHVQAHPSLCICGLKEMMGTPALRLLG